MCLREVDPLVEECSKSELARLGYSRAEINRQLKDTCQNNRASVATDLNDVFTGIGVGRFEESENGLIDDLFIGGINDSPKQRSIRSSRIVGRVGMKNCRRDSKRTGSAQAHDSDAPASRRSRDGGYSVIG